MRIEITSPCCLHLGCVRGVDGSLCELGMALQHPPIQLTARPAAQLLTSGARADVAYRQAAAFLRQNDLPLQGEIEIELAIPAFMGLGSDEMMHASVERALSETVKVSETFRTLNLYDHAFNAGGLLLVNVEGELIERAAISHASEDDDWVFVFTLPHPPDDLADDFEAQRRNALLDAARHLPPMHGVAPFDAVARDDLLAFAGALNAIHAANRAALAARGYLLEPSEQEQDILSFMRANGAAFAGRALTGLGLYGLIEGGPASRRLRKALTDHLGYFGPFIMASICDNHGAKMRIVS